MKVVQLPGHADADAQAAWLAELEGALGGAGDDPQALAWRRLRDDVRALAPPVAPDLEDRIGARIAALQAARAPRTGSRLRAGRRSWAGPRSRAARAPRTGQRSRAPRPLLAAGLATVLAALVAVVVVAPWTGGSGQSGVGGSAVAGAAKATPSVAGGPSSAPGRVQQLSASLSLGVDRAEVQTTASRVSRLAASAGGFVQSSRVQVQSASTGEATITLQLPSERLTATLAALERLAPVRSESQSLQDITGSYDAARQRLADAQAERRALLHALALAVTQGQIESLRERIAQARGTILGARHALEAVARKGRTAEVEVTVLGNARQGEGLTLHHGLRDAGHALTLALIVVLIALAVLVPLGLVLGGVVLAWRVWRRRRREHALAG